MGKSLASPTESMIKEVSASFFEPQELSRERFVALDYFNKLPLEKSVLYTKYVDIISGLTLDSFEPGLPSHLKSIPHEIAHLVKDRDEPTLPLQVDSQILRTEIHVTLEKEGIIFSSIHSPLDNNPERPRRPCTKHTPPDADHSDARHRSRVASALDGPGAAAEDVEIVFGSESQRVDAVTDLTHRSTNTTGPVLARGVLRDSARTIFKGMIRIEEGAKNSNSYLAEHAMIFSKKARADAIPGLEIMTNEVKATHSGSVSQVDEEQIFYLMSRGLSQSEAQRMIIIGFLHPAVQRIPLRTVRAAIQSLIEEKWLGRGGQIPPSPEQLPEFEEEPEKESVSADLFERHYKYR